MSEIKQCPKCGTSPFEQFLPCLVVRRRYKWIFWGRWPEFAVICRGCKNIVDYETEDDASNAIVAERRYILQPMIDTWRKERGEG